MVPIRRNEFVVVLDADDTLWWVEELYDAARGEARCLVDSTGLNGSRWESLERQLDVSNVAIFGMSPRRFPSSCVQAYEALAIESHLAPNPRVCEQISSIAERVFTTPARPVPNVLPALNRLSEIARLALLSKGDHNVQLSRLRASGLSVFFEHVLIVEEKNALSFATILDDMSVLPTRACSIGNSLQSDIIPAIEIGMWAIWVDAHVWEYERRYGTEPDSERFCRADTLIGAARLAADVVNGLAA